MIDNLVYTVVDCNLAMQSYRMRLLTESDALYGDAFRCFGGLCRLTHLAEWKRVANYYARYEEEPVPLEVRLPVACVLVKTYKYGKYYCRFYYVCYRRMHCYLDLLSIICLISLISRSETGSSSTMYDTMVS